jgi:adenine-specific DNA methylase
MTPFPAPNRLHVWWARRPLVASRAAVLYALLPSSVAESPEGRQQLLHILGIHGDPVAARKRIEKATIDGIRLGANAYGYPRAFGHTPTSTESAWIRESLQSVSDLGDIKIFDPTAGGGSIPFEASRLGFSAFSNDINPVAALIEKCTVELPSTLGGSIIQRYNDISIKLSTRLRSELAHLFPEEPKQNTRPDGYLWARTIHCPYCSGEIPLSPNWRLAPDGTGVHIHPDLKTGPGSEGRRCSFEIVKDVKHQSLGTVKGGDAACPYTDCGRVIDGDEVKRQAQAGLMGERLYAVVYKERITKKTKTGKERESWERGYRAPRPEDDVIDDIAAKVREALPEWEMRGWVPTEDIVEGSKTREPRNYGIFKWRDLFSPRQLWCHAMSVRAYREILEDARTSPKFSEVDKAAFAYVALALDKLLNYNSRKSVWMSTREVVANTFNRHDYAFCWSYSEMAPLVKGLGFDWALEETGKCIAELVELVRPGEGKSARKAAKESKDQDLDFDAPLTSGDRPKVTVTCGSADNLEAVGTASIDAVVMDPPYYNNVMYAELSDFFYVWLKRTAGELYPELFSRLLTDKDREAVANPAKFQGQKGAGKLANEDYRYRMMTIFRECRRVLKDDGIMVLMFTHKAVGAWDALTSGLMEAGFAVSASWPVNTEAEGSLHIRDKAACNSTVFLVCRPRLARASTEETIFWEDLEPAVRARVRERIESYRAGGIRGIDLYLASFGPALEVFSSKWPVKRASPKINEKVDKKGQKDLEFDKVDPYLVMPEDVLLVARREVTEWRLAQLSSMARQAHLDALTEFFVLAWDAFEAPAFDYDEALQLARVVGLDLDKDICGKIAYKKGSDVILWDAETRAAAGGLGPADGSRAMLDALHHAIIAARRGTLQTARDQLERASLSDDSAFLATLESVLEVLPPSRQFTGLDPSEALAPSANDFELLENLRRLAFSEKVGKPEQLELWQEG